MLLFILIGPGVHAAGLTVSWSSVAEDIDGNPIPQNVLEYIVYGSRDGSPFVALGRTPSNTAMTEELPLGCYEVYVTAYRKDEMLESIPSERAAQCLDGNDDDGTVVIPASAPRAPEIGPMEKIIRR